MTDFWQSDHDRAYEMAEKIHSDIKNLATISGPKGPAASRIRSQIANVNAKIRSLEQLLMQHARNPAAAGVDKAELDKRGQLVRKLQQFTDALSEDVRKATGGGAGGSSNPYAQNTAGPSSSDFIGRSGELEAFSNMTQSQHMMANENMLETQDRQLDALGESIAVMKGIGHEMGNELDIQSQMISDLEDGVEDTTWQMKGQTKRIKEIGGETSTFCLWVIIFVLFIILMAIRILL